MKLNVKSMDFRARCNPALRLLGHVQPDCRQTVRHRAHFAGLILVALWTLC